MSDINIKRPGGTVRNDAAASAKILPGGSPIPAGDLIATDGITCLGDGSVEHPVRALASVDPWARRTQIALTHLFAQLQQSANFNLNAHGAVGAAVLGNVIGSGTFNNLTSNRNLGDPNSAGAVFGPIAFTGTRAARLTGMVSADNDAALGFQESFFFNQGPYGLGAVIIQNGMNELGGVFTLGNLDPLSIDENQMALPGNVDLIMPFGTSALFLYRTDTSKWELQS